ncbi:MAG: PadR family transcriptional regulator [Streptosporangiaceae bacterium]|jgi:DNA-binding PadR family transcriptional regulator
MRNEESWRRRDGDPEMAGWPGGSRGSWRGHNDDDERRPRGGGRRGHVRGGGFPGRPPFGEGPLGPHGFGPWMHEPRMRGPRARRGDVRAAALSLLAEGPMNGYQIIQAIGERSGGVWRASPGSVYPALQQLEDEGLIRAESDDSGRRAYVLTDEGRGYADAHPDELRAPWDELAGSAGGAAIEMRSLIGQVAMAAFQVVSAGTDAQVAQARKVVTECRKSLYRILAADDDEAGGGGA